MAAREAVREPMHLKWLQYFMHGKMDLVKVKADNNFTIFHVRNSVLKDNGKHINVVYNHIRERHDAGYVELCWILGFKMLRAFSPRCSPDQLAT
jgi:hypothetical protein